MILNKNHGMKCLLFIAFSAIPLFAKSQSILGTWQLVKESTCLESNMRAEADSVQNLLNDMKSRSGASPQIVKFKEKQVGEESTRILNKKKPTNHKNFYYKYSGETLLILDKKSQTITDNYMVDKISADSLILSNAARPCETRIFLKIKDAKSN